MKDRLGLKIDYHFSPNKVHAMRIEGIALRVIRLPLKEPFRISSGVTAERRILLTRIQMGGREGLGECVAGEAPFYSAETVDTARHVIERYLGPALLGRALDGPDAAGRLLDEAARGHRMAKAALEMAVRDAFARSDGVSLAAALGGTADAVPAGVSLGIQPEVDVLLDQVARFLGLGYRRVKLKIAPGQDLDVVAAVRARHPDIDLTVDANGAYGAADMDRLEGLDEYGLAYIEQPFPADALLLHADLQARMETPICLDETVTGPERCRDALRVGACRVVNIKPGRVGGHGPSLAIHDLCADAGVPVWCGGMLESGIGRAHNVALASLPNMRFPGDTSASDRYWERDIVVPAFALNADGTVDVPTGPGIGVEIDEDFLEAVTVDRSDVRAAG